MKTRVFFNVDLPTTRYLAFASIWEALLWRLIDTVALNWCPYPCDKSKYICFYSRNPRRSIRSFFLGTSLFIRVTLPPSPCAHEAQLGVVAWPAQILLAVVPKEGWLWNSNQGTTVSKIPPRILRATTTNDNPNLVSIHFDTVIIPAPPEIHNSQEKLDYYQISTIKLLFNVVIK